MSEVRGRRAVVYCNYLQPGGVERVSVRLVRLMRDGGADVHLVSRDGSPVYEAATEAVSTIGRRDRVIFSRKSDVQELGVGMLLRGPVYWRHIPYFQLRPWRRAVDLAFTVVMSWVGRIACNCDELRDVVASIPGVRSGAAYTCYSPLPLGDPGTVSFRKIDAQAPIELVYFGREGDQKLVEDAVRLVAETASRGIRVRLHIYGYERARAFRGVDPSVYTFEGITDDVPSVLAAADGLLVVSAYEAFPTVMVEAAQAGLPIFCNRFEVGRRDFERLVGPLNIVEPEDPASLVHALRGHAAGAYSFSAFKPSEVAAQWTATLT